MAFVPAESSAVSHDMDVCVAIHRGRLLCPLGSHWSVLDREALTFSPSSSQSHYLGTLDEQHCFAVFFLGDEPSFPGYDWQDLRSQLGLLSEEAFQLAGRALQITRWYRDHQFCGACGSKTRESNSDRALVCGQCDQRFYPRISPCVIGLVTRGDECLLARGSRIPEGLFSTLAGFIEPGESAEQALIREVKEEVGIDIKNLRYFDSQPWPFPGQLMLGFHAEYDGGELVLEEEEILEAGWFHKENLPHTPPVGTIAGRLIQAFKEEVEA